MTHQNLPLLIAGSLKDRATHAELATFVHEASGLVVAPYDPKPDEPGESKRDRILAAMDGKSERELADVARRTGQFLRDFRLEELGLTILEKDEKPITEIVRRDVAKCFGDDLTSSRPLMKHLETLFDFNNMWVGDAFVQKRLSDLIERHMLRNFGDWSVEELFENLNAYTCSRSRFCRLIEGGLHPLARRGEEQKVLAASINAHLRRSGYELRAIAEDSGYPVYQVLPIGRGVAGAPKNLIFASKGPKPEIGFSDAINNDIIVLSNADSCLIYERPIGTEGLTWANLVDWWKSHSECDLSDPPKSLGVRLQRSLDSDAEKMLFSAFFKVYRPKMGANLPALLPQVYLHYDPAVVSRLRHRNSLPRQRMDFLLLLPNNVRVVLEVDGSQHFSEDKKPSLPAYAKMVSADRDLRLAGYEMYRFGANELVGTAAPTLIEKFFDRLWERHRMPVSGR